MAEEWKKKGFVDDGFLAYLKNEEGLRPLVHD